MKRLICGYQFELIATIEAEHDLDGRIRQFSPQNSLGGELSSAPFCRFRFPSNRALAGVYAIVVSDRVVYVGQTNNLSRRFGAGEYGHIVVPTPGNSQVTNRRINHGILEAALREEVVQVWFHSSSDRERVEADIIGKLDLAWNREAPRVDDVVVRSVADTRHEWPSAMRGAEAAKAMFQRDQARAQRLFDELLRAYPDDGMVYLKRAEAHERLGDLTAAATNYARAEQLLPFPGRKAEARAGLKRTVRHV